MADTRPPPQKGACGKRHRRCMSMASASTDRMPMNPVGDASNQPGVPTPGRTAHQGDSRSPRRGTPAISRGWQPLGNGNIHTTSPVGAAEWRRTPSVAPTGLRCRSSTPQGFARQARGAYHRPPAFTPAYPLPVLRTYGSPLPGFFNDRPPTHFLRSPYGISSVVLQ